MISSRNCSMHSLITADIFATNPGISYKACFCLALASTDRICCRMDLIPIESTVDFNLWDVLPTCSQFSDWVALLSSSTFCGTVSIKRATIFLIKPSSPPDTDCTMERSYSLVFTCNMLVWFFKGKSASVVAAGCNRGVPADTEPAAMLDVPTGEEYFARFLDITRNILSSSKALAR